MERWILLTDSIGTEVRGSDAENRNLYHNLVVQSANAEVQVYGGGGQLMARQPSEAAATAMISAPSSWCCPDGVAITMFDAAG